MKFIFSCILLVHGLIHLMGFVKAFQIAEINQLTQSISKPIGMLWLVTSLLFLFSLILFLFKRDGWFVISIIAVVASQIAIILFWNDAKFGTIANSIILLVSVVAYGSYQFNTMVQKESEIILQDIQLENLSVILEEDIAHLPKIIQKWMHNSGVIGKENIVSVSLTQKGEMRTKLGSTWMTFTAIQHFNVENPAFVWTTKVDAMPILKMIGRDKLYHGEGEMLIKLASLIPVVNEGNNPKINQGAMVRFLAESCWFPSLAISDSITWETINDTLAKATLTAHGKSVSGVFNFSPDGDLISFEAQRYYGGKNDSKLERWHVNMLSYRTFNGIKIPNKSTVTWKLKEGDFNWLNLEITDIKFNYSPF